ncbi:hypothetical protein B0H67DRAFT_487607 [Lasiosphaeris hirsuta]|uniref:MOSC domain-containing protein n=1 Tax=Lasiosphaeris hirsuta TaxID=260670 RepID=A0AA40AH74_9PEZI|nr:hypothetical protein B0H67DRAFT_487607 [Lasiosphaeris hirsuta]
MDDFTDTALQSGPAVDAAGIFLVFITIIVFMLPVLIYFPPVPPSKSEALLQTHSPVGLASSKSGLRGHRGRHAPSVPEIPAKIRSLWIYPVKSCKGIEVSQSKVLPTGLEFDRLYTFAQLKSPFPVALDASDEEKSQHRWEFITQRQFPLLATVEVDLYVPDIAKAQDKSATSGEAFIVVRFPWQERGVLGALGWVLAKLTRGWRALPEMEIVLPVEFPSPDETYQQGYSYDKVTVWKETVTALNLEPELPWELRLYLGVSNRLGIFRIDPARLRPVYRCAPTEADAGYQPAIGFQDAYPLHLLNLPSVRDLDAKIDRDNEFHHLDPRRFRANIIVDGAAAYDEDTWKTIRFNPEPSSTRERSAFHVSCRTVRCKMPNVDPDTGSRHAVEPDRSLRKFRDVDEGAKKKGCLGMQLTPLFDNTESMESWVEVGMSLEVMARGDHRYIVQ